MENQWKQWMGENNIVMGDVNENGYNIYCAKYSCRD